MEIALGWSASLFVAAEVTRHSTDNGTPEITIEADERTREFVCCSLHLSVSLCRAPGGKHQAMERGPEITGVADGSTVAHCLL